jgi:hypothetical protein
MELREFIAQSLIQISRGVEDAQKELATNGALLNPTMGSLFPSNGKDTYTAFGWAENDQSSSVFLVDFDVAVTAVEGTHTKGGIGVVAGVFALGSQGQSENKNTAISRIQFKVPVKLATHEKQA